MAEKSRSTVCAIVEESVSGTLEVPSTGTSYVPLEEGSYSLTPTFDVIENNEIKASIAKSKPILGIESVEGALDLYLKHSGVEGQAPNYSPLLKSAFGAVETNATQYLTASGSTVQVINTTAGSGAFFARGEAVLIKDATNNYSIRPIQSVATDALTLAFDVSAAPASGIGLGKAIKYTALAAGSTTTISKWLFQGNAGAIEASAGNKVTSYQMTVEAGDVVNQSFSLQGTKYYFNPITITSSSKYIDFTTDAGTVAAELTVKTYRDPLELAEEIASKMDAVAGGSETISCVYNSIGASAGKFTITAAGTAVFSLLWQSGTNTANSAKTKLGFSNTNDTGALTYTSDSVQSWAAYSTPDYDDADLLVAKNQEVYFGDHDDITCYGVESFTFTMEQGVVDVKDICQETAIAEKLLNSRDSTIEAVLTLKRHEAETFYRFRVGTTISFMYAFGSKTGSNWNAGKCGCLYLPSVTITDFSVADADGIVTINLSMAAFADSDGNPEVYLNFL